MCVNNKKKILWIKYEGPCKLKPVKIGKFMPVANSDYFMVRYKCALCGREKVNHFVEWDTLLKQGLTNDELISLQHTQF